MNSRIVRNADNEDFNIEVIRYFVNNDIEYLIYSLNEVDESGYTKLYACKIIGNKASIITDNDEWNLIKEIIKQVVKNNRDGIKLSIIDLNEDNLNDVVITDSRVFKLQGNLVNLLQDNKQVIKEEPPVLKEEVTVIDEEIDYEQLYNELLIKNKQLEDEIIELSKNKEIIEKMKELLEIV